MTDLTSLFTTTEQKYGLPPGILRASAQVESSNRPGAVSSQGAEGIMQLMPDTAKALKADPFNVSQAIDGAGRLWQQNLQATNGDIDRAAMMYHGGPDTSKWGRKTHAYPGKLAAALGPAPQAQGGGDPIEAALSGHAPAPQNAPAQIDANDPIENALSHGMSGADAAPNSNLASVSHSNQGGVPASSVPANAGGRLALGNAQGTRSGQQGRPSGGLQQDQVGWLGHLSRFAQGTENSALNGFSAGLVKPLDALIDTVIPFAAVSRDTDAQKAWGGQGFSAAFHHNLGEERAEDNNFSQQHPYAAGASDLVGVLASPFNKLFAPAEGAGLIRSGLGFAGQGAAYGGTRGLADTGDPKTAALDATLGAVLGPLGAGAASVVGKVLGAALKARSTMASAIPQSTKQQIASMIDHGASAQEIYDAIPDAKTLAHVPEWVKYRAQGGKEPTRFGVPPQQQSAPQQYASALQGQTARRGIEAVSDVPPQVQAHVQRLTNAGVHPLEAQREADILYVGAKPTVAAVTRSPEEQLAFNEGAKDTSTPAGKALNETQSANNQALHETLNNTVENYGGVPAQGEATQNAAEALAKASDASKAKVSALYETARATDGEVKVNTDELRNVLQSPELATPTNPQVKQLADGISSHLSAVDKRAGTSLRTPEQIEDLRQLANSAYDPMGGQVNSAIRKISGALNDGLDQLDNASAAYKAARAAHRDWASQYADPQGVSQLIRRDAGGNFINADNWRKVENGLTGMIADKPFIQAITQLKNIGATDALSQLKASIVKTAADRATNSAYNARGVPVINGKLFQGELNKIGMPKLEALFSPDEIAHLATIGRAARTLNEPVPGTLNTSNTAIASTRSSLAQALAAKPGSHPIFTGLKLGAAAMGHVPAAVAIHGAEQLSSRAAQRAIDQGAREQLNTGLARAMAGRSIKRINNAAYRHQVGRALKSRGALESSEDRRKALAGALSNAL